MENIMFFIVQGQLHCIKPNIIAVWYGDEQVDKHSGGTKKRVITVPSVESIEEMRSSIEVTEDCISDNKSKRSQMEIKTPGPRTPFADVN